MLCTCNKLLEHIILKHISDFLERSKLLDSRQRRFLRRFSTIAQLVQTVHSFAEVLNRQGQVDVVFLDFSKAFDRMSH